MKLLIPDPFSFPGGIETLNLALINSLEKLAERIVWVLPEYRINYFKSYLPPTDRLIYESFVFQDKSINRYIQAITNRLVRTNKKYNSQFGKSLNDWLLAILHKQRLEFLIKKYHITHCLYTWIPDQSFPGLSVNTAGIILDLNWHIFPENFRESANRLDEKLQQWLKQASVLFAISRSVYDEVAVFSPQFSSKVKVVPLAHESFVQNIQAIDDSSNISPPVFYYPASALNHKNHYTLFQAVFKLAQKGLEFELVLTGSNTHDLISDSPSLAPEVERCRQFYHRNFETLASCVKALGRVDRLVVDSLYQTCRCVVIPTRYEGFGLPLVEALSWGTPVICSEIAPLRDQVELYHCHDLVHFFPVDDVEALASSMAAMITENSVVRLRPQEVQQRLQRWTWNDVARDYILEMM
ncbi:MAG: glycosyltransferase [Anaerolineae bacterium]|nr:glycosyltransferase [Gloeobacterales cyanobacterium ES-bin-313]